MDLINFLHFTLLFVLLLPIYNGEFSHATNSSSRKHRRHKRLSHGVFDEKSLGLARSMVSIRTRTARAYYGDNHFCAGAIIAPTFVLSSAHCVITKRRLFLPRRMLLIVAGTPNRLKYMERRSFHTPVTRIIAPDNFTIYNTNDIVLLQTKIRFPRSNFFINIIDLPLNPPQIGELYDLCGWGRLYRGGPLTSNIVHIRMPLISSEVCQKILHVTKTDMLCTFDENAHSAISACFGDLGSPLVRNRTVFGIVSSTVGCSIHNMPCIFTDVYQNVDWILRNMVIKKSGATTHVFESTTLLLVLQIFYKFYCDFD
ncbi:uncharacterized protein Dana_GF10796 [Drosophila ananassae]|uniref:Peptidase S1 domain-containing protein n=1 Tax=Drosophila ananassae TaxID=7217 RepID=B3M7Q8_DROAN|nr:chymotrypsin-2 [Drosophila ananassae]EDV40986.1 uncharacterized protein Dana_GF10796 [Drosophila ananassae]